MGTEDVGAGIDGSAPELALGEPSGRWLDEGVWLDAGKPPPDRAKRLKERLEAKARAGAASDSELRMLRALCRQLGDKSCMN